MLDFVFLFKVKNRNKEVIDLISGVNETRLLVQHESCQCNGRLNKSVCNSKQKWNHNECWCECKELDDWGSFEKGYMWNPSICHCKCNKACKIDEYLDTKSCSCGKHLDGKLALECENKTLNRTETLLNDKKACAKRNYLIHIISSVIMFLYH